jgi:hypothetical protein
LAVADTRLSQEHAQGDPTELTATGRLPGLFYLLFFLAALLVEWRSNGGSPRVWFDTITDENAVRQCLAGGGCSFDGLPSSVPHFVNPSGWLDMHTVLEGLGLRVEGLHRLTLVGNALALVAIVRSAEMLGGAQAAVFAACFSWKALDVGVVPRVVYSGEPMMMLGAIFLAVLILAMQRPTLRYLTLAGLCGAVMASIHASSTPAVFSVAVAAFRAQRRRVWLAMGAIVAFWALEYLTTPAGWVKNWQALRAEMHGVHGSWSAHLLANKEAAAALIWAVGLLALWGASAARIPALRRALDAPVAVGLPPLLVFLTAAAWGMITPNWKYLAYVSPALVVAAAVAASSIWSTRQSGSLLQTAAVGIAGILLVSRVGAIWFTSSTVSESELRISDVRAAARVLADEHGWSWTDAENKLQTPSFDAMVTLREFLPDKPGTRDSTGAFLLKVPSSRLPSPLPRNWKVASVDDSYTTLLAFAPSWLDWANSQACTVDGSGAERCVSGETDIKQSGDWLEPAIGPKVPYAPAGMLSRLRLHVPVVVPAGAMIDRLSVAQTRRSCGGRVISVADAADEASVIDPGGDSATLQRSPTGAGPREVVFEWSLGDPRCTSEAGQLHPFVVEGDPVTVGLIENLLRRSSS